METENSYQIVFSHFHTLLRLGAGTPGGSDRVADTAIIQSKAKFLRFGFLNFQPEWTSTQTNDFFENFRHLRICDARIAYDLAVADTFPELFALSSHSSYFRSIARFSPVFVSDAENFPYATCIYSKIQHTIICIVVRYWSWRGRLFNTNSLSAKSVFPTKVSLNWNVSVSYQMSEKKSNLV